MTQDFKRILIFVMKVNHLLFSKLPGVLPYISTLVVIIPFFQNLTQSLIFSFHQLFHTFRHLHLGLHFFWHLVRINIWMNLCSGWTWTWHPSFQLTDERKTFCNCQISQWIEFFNSFLTKLNFYLIKWYFSWFRSVLTDWLLGIVFFGIHNQLGQTIVNFHVICCLRRSKHWY